MNAEPVSIPPPLAENGTAGRRQILRWIGCRYGCCRSHRHTDGRVDANAAFWNRGALTQPLTLPVIIVDTVDLEQAAARRSVRRNVGIHDHLVIRAIDDLGAVIVVRKWNASFMPQMSH